MRHTVPQHRCYRNQPPSVPGWRKGCSKAPAVDPGVILAAVVSCRLRIISEYGVHNQHTVVSLPLSHEEKVLFNHPAYKPVVILAAVMSCKLSSPHDVPPSCSGRPSSVHRRGKRGGCSVQWHRPSKSDSCCSDELPAKNKQCV